jgi:hypothetical protein
MLTKDIGPTETVLDIGCGNKGVIAQAYWEQDVSIRKGYACDIHVIKQLPPLWEPLLMDAEGLLERLGPKSVDVVTHCGFLEHVEYEKAFRILRVIEQIAKKLVYFSCSTVLREVTYKAKRDGNWNHLYRSWWDATTMESLGYTVDIDRMSRGETFRVELQGWFYPDRLVDGIHGAFPQMVARRRGLTSRWDVSKLLVSGRHCFEDDCTNESVGYDPRLPGCFCFEHAPLEERLQNPKEMPSEAPDFPKPPEEWR